MAFSIYITDQQFDPEECEEVAVRGVLEMGPFREEFLASLEVWSIADYKRQWEIGLRRALSSDRSCLITSMRDLAVSDFIDSWMLYRVGNEMVFQNQVLIATEEYGSVTADTIYEMVPDRETHSEDGEKISEWKIPIRDIEMFLVNGKN